MAGLTKRVDQIEVGDWIDRDPYYGEIVEIHPHGRKIGDGTVDWFTFRVRHWNGVRLLSYSDAMGPLKATDELLVPEPKQEKEPSGGGKR